MPFGNSENECIIFISKKRINCGENSLPGQAWVLQEFVFEADPTQVFPPCCGAGLVQVLVRIWLPPPQDFEHAPKFP